MKKLTMILSLVMLFALAANTFAQTKGETQLAIGGSLYENTKGRASGSTSSYMIFPAAVGRYMFTDKIGIDGGLGFFKGKNVDLGIDLLIGGRYYYYAKDKMKVNGGLDIGIGLGKGNETFDDKLKKVSMPIDLTLTLAELEYWPMEGGALYGDLFYMMEGLNRGDAGSNSFGIGLGVKVRIK